jgi:hypothetical protein
MMSCECNCGDKSVAQKVLGVLLCAKINGCFVKKITELALPVLFWLSVIGSFCMACKLANSFHGWSFGSFVAWLVVFLICVLLTFYWTYLLKDIRNALSKDACCCTDGACDMKAPEAPAAVVAAAPKKRGPKPGSKRGPRKKAE